MSVFTVHTLVHRDGLPVAFAPGDELPDWAVGKVGDHCLADTGSKPRPAPAAESTPEPADDKPVPDFTKPAPARRGRPPKK